MHRRVIQVARLALGIGLLVFLLYRVDTAMLTDALHQSLSRKGWLAWGIALTFLGLLMGVFRWKVILDAEGYRLPTVAVFQLFYIGQFFNAFMPGACGGDVARAYYVVKEQTPGQRAETASTVFVDRAVGLLATIFFCCVMILWRLPFFLSHFQTRGPGIVLLLFLAASIAGLVILFRRNLFEHWEPFRRLERATALGSLVRRTYDTFYRYRNRHLVLLVALALSLANLLCLTLACAAFARSLEIHLPLNDYLTLFPVITTLAALPVTPGALGVREGLFVGLFATLDVEPARAMLLSLLVYAGGLLWSLVGAVFFVGYSSKERLSILGALRALRREHTPPDTPADDGAPP